MPSHGQRMCETKDELVLENKTKGMVRPKLLACLLAEGTLCLATRVRAARATANRCDSIANDVESCDARPRTVHRMLFAVPATTDVRPLASRFHHGEDRTLHAVDRTKDDDKASIARPSVRCTCRTAMTVEMAPEVPVGFHARSPSSLSRSFVRDIDVSADLPQVHRRVAVEFFSRPTAVTLLDRQAHETPWR